MELTPGQVSHDFCCGAGEQFVQQAEDVLWEWAQDTKHEDRVGELLNDLLPVVLAYGDARALSASSGMQGNQPQDVTEQRAMCIRFQQIVSDGAGGERLTFSCECSGVGCLFGPGTDPRSARPRVVYIHPRNRPPIPPAS